MLLWAGKFSRNAGWCQAQRWLPLLVLLLVALPGVGQGRLRYEGWQLEWEEEFDGPGTADSAGLAQRWQFAYPWGRNLLPNPETQFYTAAEVQPGAAGTLRLGARKLAQPRQYFGKTLRYEAGMLYSHHAPDSLHPSRYPPGNGFSYGLFEVRCRQPASRAAFPAFWLFGGAPDEIDIFEGIRWGISNNIHLNPNDYWRPFAQGAETCQCHFASANPAADLHDEFHTYSLSWLPGELIFYFDGFPIRRETRYMPLGFTMSLILNLAMLDWAEIPQDSLMVDYVRVYSPTNGTQLRGSLAPAFRTLSEFQYLPRLAPLGLDPNLGSLQRWELRRDTTGQVALELVENRNPACFSSSPLPWGGHWAPPWRITGGQPELLVALTDSLPLHWTLTNVQGSTHLRGTVPAGSLWRPNWDRLEPGSYSVLLQIGPARRQHTLHVLSRPSSSSPTTSWLSSEVKAAPTAESP